MMVVRDSKSLHYMDIAKDRSMGRKSYYLAATFI